MALKKFQSSIGLLTVFSCAVPFFSTHTQVLIYSGQLDVLVAAPLTERFLPTVNWSGAAEYKTTPRYHWKVQPSDTEVAGYVRQVGEFYQVGCEQLRKGHL